jgi:ComF family protein
VTKQFKFERKLRSVRRRSSSATTTSDEQFAAKFELLQSKGLLRDKSMNQDWPMIDRALGWVLDFILPFDCVGCHQEGELWCRACLAPYLEGQRVTCPMCPRLTSKGQFCSEHRPKTSLTGLLSVGHYQDPRLRLAIHRFKYERIAGYADYLGQLMIKRLTNSFGDFLLAKTLLVAPVPLSFWRERIRGFNQARLLAETVASHFHLSYAPDLMVKHWGGSTQAQLKSVEERVLNAEDRYRVSRRYQVAIKGKMVLLIDDVMTSGATLNECARCLRREGVRTVWGAVVATGW